MERLITVPQMLIIQSVAAFRSPAPQTLIEFIACSVCTVDYDLKHYAVQRDIHILYKI